MAISFYALSLLFGSCRLSELPWQGLLKDEMIRERIVVGLQGSKLSKKLQIDPALSLAKAISQAWQSATIKKQ